VLARNPRGRATGMSFYVQVIEFESGKVERELGPYVNERLAEKADDGLTRQLNHERYYTRIEARPSK
jgi:hypothetical protein